MAHAHGMVACPGSLPSCSVPGGVSSGTGFLLDIGDEDVYFVPVLMTNKHVIQGTSQFGTLRRPPGDTDLPDFGKRLDFAAGPEDPFIVTQT